MIVNGRTIVADTSRTSAQWFTDVSPHNLAHTAVNMPEVITAAVRHVIASGYSEMGDTFILTEYRIGVKPDDYGNSVYATIIYGANGRYAASIAGHHDGKGRIVWETYMD